MSTEYKSTEDRKAVFFRQGNGTKIHLDTCAVSYGGRNIPKVTVVATVVIPAGSTRADSRAWLSLPLRTMGVGSDHLCTKCNYWMKDN